MVMKLSELTVLGDDGIRRSFDEHYDTMMDVEQDPTGATWAIQKQADRIEELEAKLAEVTAERDKFQKYSRLNFADWEKATAHAEAAEAMLPRAYRAGVEAASDCIGHITRTEDFEAILALPTPKPAELLARFKENPDAQALANPKVQALLSYAGHRRRCSLMSAFVEGKACTCGYDAALAALEKDDG
jgi:hypothetical protein